MEIAFLDVFYKWNHTMYVFNLTLCFQVSSMLLHILILRPFYDQIVFCCMDIPWVCEWDGVEL